MKRSDILVSIIMPAYNAEEYIENSIRSAMAQTFTNWELLVVDDCSKDATREIVNQLAEEDHRIRLIHNEENLGTAGSRNKALDLFHGSYVAFLDSDDLWHPEKLEKQLRLMRDKNADLCYSSYCVVHLDGGKARKDYVVPKSVTLEDMLKQNFIGCSTVVLTAETAKKYRFTKKFYHEDYIFWLSMLRDGIKAVGIPEILMDYSYYSSSRAGNKPAAAKRRWNIYRKYMNFSALKSLWYMIHYTVAGIKKYHKG